MAAVGLVAMDLLDPFEIDHRYDADLEIAVLGHVELARYQRAVQSLVEHEVGAGLDVLPWRERTGRASVQLGAGLVVDVVARPPAAAFAVGLERRLEFSEQVGLEPEMAERIVAVGGGLCDRLLHADPVVAMECIALDESGLHAFTPEDLLERHLDGGGAGPRRAGDGNDGMLGGHGAVGDHKDRFETTATLRQASTGS